MDWPTPTIADASFWPQALTSGLTLTCAVIVVLCLFAVSAGILILRRIHRQTEIQNQQSPITCTRGTATIEFALVFPILLFLMLLLAQTTMLMAGNLFVHYSAFAATRTAIVQIPRDVPGCPTNCYIHNFGREKHDAIWRSAVHAVAPAGSRLGGSGSGVNVDAYVQGLHNLYEGYGRTTPPWVDQIAGPRLAYAADHTAITVMHVEVLPDDTVAFHEVPTGASHPFGAHDPVTVLVEHRLALGVPYINRIYSDGETGGGQYRLVAARYTLSNEGMVDELPPQPTIPRTTP